jgi:ATPase family associated with various cellular activities (AAA)
VSLDPQSHLCTELARCATLLGRRLQDLRDRGKSPAGEAMQGFVIEDGEAEGLVAELTARWGRTSGAPIAEKSETLSPGTADTFLPLCHAIRQFDLRAIEYDAMLLALAVELDGVFGRLVAYLNDHVGRTRPTLGLAVGLQDANFTLLSPLAFYKRPAVRDGLLEIEGDGPAPGWSLLVPRDLVLRLSGEAPPDALPAGFRCFAPAPDLLDRLVLATGVRDGLAAWAASARPPGFARPLILSGLPGAGRTTAARGIAGILRSKLLVAEVSADQMADRLRAARREASWHDAPLLLRIAVPDTAGTIDWRVLWHGLADLRRPLMLATAPQHAEALAAAAPLEPAIVTFPEPSLAERAALWRALLPPGTSRAAEVADHLAARFRFNPGRIARAARRAEPAGLTPDALMLACREVGAAAMGSLAQKLPLPYAWDDLVVPPLVRKELELARVWVRHQRQVLDLWGFGGRVAMGRGLTMLFGGPPGTGKTMAAQVLAGTLALDLYRVDLSRVVNKYIGETEKNLSVLFDEAQASGAVLFFDEADALFGKRSEVKDAHDRYANLEIGYLLQRMEEYEGITVLASNRARDMDEAFTRRFQFIVDFPIPDEAHRLKIWQGMLPPEAELDGELDLAALAKRFETSGGEIKNAVLAAAFVAAGEQVPLGTTQLIRAVRREFRKGGRLSGDRN